MNRRSFAVYRNRDLLIVILITIVKSSFVIPLQVRSQMMYICD